MNYSTKKIRTLAITLAMTTALSSPTLAWQDADQDTDKENDIEEIIVTSGKLNKKLEDITSSVAIVTSQELEDQMVSDLNQMFRNEPGVSVTGNSGSAQNVVIRGMSGDRVLMIKDGMRMNEGYGADGANDIVGRGNVDMSTLKQVEVAKGPASAQYGADAMAGIVIFTTKDPDDYLDGAGDDFALLGKAGYAGVNDQSSFGGTVAVRTGRLVSSLSVTKNNGGETQNYYDESNNMEVDSIAILAKAKLNINDNANIVLSYDLWDQDSYTPDAGKGDYGLWQNLSGYKFVYIDSNADVRTEAYKADFHYKSDVIESIDMSFYRNKTEQNDGNLQVLEIDSGFTMDTGRNYINSGIYDQITYGFKSNLVNSFEIGSRKNDYAIGFDYEKTTSGRVSTEFRDKTGPGYTEVETRNIVVDKFPRNDVKRIGVYFADYLDLIDDKLTVNFGTRYDKFTMTPETSPDDVVEYSEISKGRFSSNAGLNFKATDTLSIVGNYSEGYKVPPYDLAYIYHDNSFVAFPYYGYVVHPSEDLEAETSKSIEVGVRFNDDKWNFSAYYFNNKYRNFIEIRTLYWEFPYADFGYPNFGVEHTQYVNVDSVNINGVEASLAYQFNDEFSAFANMSIQSGKNQATDEYIRTISPLNGVVGVSYHTDQAGVDLTMSWAAEMNKVVDGGFINPGYQVFDATAYFNLMENVTLRVGIKNFFDKRYTEFSSVSSMAAGENSDNRTRPGRNLSANVAIAF